jgi:predicted ATP-dependent serine protease
MRPHLLFSLPLRSHPTTSALISCTDRLPTISAAAALAGVSKNGRGNAVSTGLAGLDRALGGGLRKGEVSEMWGPPGCGKTIFG